MSLSGNGYSEEVQGSRGGRLRAAPIMVYPFSPDQRTAFQAAADAVGRSLSNFMVTSAEEHIASKIDFAKPYLDTAPRKVGGYSGDGRTGLGAVMTEVIPLSEYLRSSFEPDAEFVDGRIEKRPMGERDHSDLQTQMLALLTDKAYKQHFIARAELRVQTKAKNYRVPDVCVLKAGSPREQIVTTPPILCIEVLSPEDTMSRTMVRVREFLAMGVQEVWVFDAERRSVEVFAGSAMTEHRTGSLRVPSTPIELDLAEIFSVLDEG